MATDVKVKTMDLELRTVRLTKAILKQLPVVSHDKVRHLINPTDGHPHKDALDGGHPQGFIGWVHGSVLGDEDLKWLIVKFGEGDYGRFAAMPETLKGVVQIYIV